MCKSPVWIAKERFWAPCGHCPHCRVSKSREWVIRLLNEYVYYKNRACFLTLTYRPEDVPVHSSGMMTLFYRDVQLCMENLRIQSCCSDMKYFVAGEYGDRFTKRPHYHVILFGLSIADVWKFFDEKKIWKYGKVDIGYSFNSKVCGYTAQYALKKLKTKTYDLLGQAPPFVHMSKGIGRRFCLKNEEEILQKGYIQHQKFKFSIPRYYFKVWNLDRREYYRSDIASFNEELVLSAQLKNIPVFFDMSAYSPKQVAIFMRFCEKEGHIFFYSGVFRVTTPEFESYVRDIRLQVNRNIAARFKPRDKV